MDGREVQGYTAVSHDSLELPEELKMLRPKPVSVRGSYTTRQAPSAIQKGTPQPFMDCKPYSPIRSPDPSPVNLNRTTLNPKHLNLQSIAFPTLAASSTPKATSLETWKKAPLPNLPGLHPKSDDRTLHLKALLGGPWDFVIAYNWDYSPTYPRSAFI